MTGDLALSYAVTEEWNVYGKIARGYLSGNHVLPFTGAIFNVVDPEEIDAFEIGAKGTAADGRLQVYGALFYYDYTNIQVNRGLTVPGQGGFISVRENAGEATVTGAELEIQFRPTDRWLLSTGLGYTDAEFDEFFSDNPAGGVDDFAGFKFPNVPEFNGNVAASYSHPLSGGGTLELATDWNYADDYFVDTNFDPVSMGESRTVGNLYVRYYAPTDNWSFAFYAKNVADEEYVVNRRSFANALEGNLVIYGEPRVIGVNLNIDF